MKPAHLRFQYLYFLSETCDLENLETPVCFFFLHVHYHFFKKCLMLLFKNLLLFLLKLTGNQDCRHLVSAWLGARSHGDSAVEEGWDTERGRRRTATTPE